MGNSSGNSSKESKFKREAHEVIEIFELSIVHKGFPQSEIKKLNTFYDMKVVGQEEEIKKRIMMLHIEFFGGMDFKNREDPKNEKLMAQLSKDIKEIRELLENL